MQDSSLSYPKVDGFDLGLGKTEDHQQQQPQPYGCTPQSSTDPSQTLACYVDSYSDVNVSGVVDLLQEQREHQQEPHHHSLGYGYDEQQLYSGHLGMEEPLQLTDPEYALSNNMEDASTAFHATHSFPDCLSQGQEAMRASSSVYRVYREGGYPLPVQQEQEEQVNAMYLNYAAVAAAAAAATAQPQATTTQLVSHYNIH